MEKLTGFPDREQFLKVAEQRRKQVLAARKPPSLLLVSIDNFRECGGTSAEVCLRSVSEVIHAHTDDTDCLVGHVRTHEFAILYCGGTGRGADELAESIRKDVESLGLRPTADGDPLTVSSCVITHVPWVRRHVEALLIAADRGLREAIRRGGNLVIGR